ncbi:MAG: glucose-6-phosphate isomerase [Clostridia bacterium]|nr:glucose-6-phosphate isomerase [Clostridia bacterium]
MKKYIDKNWQNEMKLRLDYNNMLSNYVGGGQGLTEEELEANVKIAEEAFKSFEDIRGSGMTDWVNLPYNQSQIIEDIEKTASEIRQNYEYFVVLGIGGSALGPIAVFNALCHLHHNDLPKEKRNAPKFYVEDNVDPERMVALLDVIEPDKTMFNVVTKSGATSETMAQYLIIVDILKNIYKKDISKHVIATTSASKGNLIKIAKQENLKTFYIPDGVGGRFSELCPVGLLPASVLGIDIGEFLKGAEYMDKLCSTSNFNNNPALASAYLSYLTIKQGKNISVMMPYTDSLKYIADWYCQLWAESLGKEVDKNGNYAYVGQTPVKSLGVTDQHSQVQLYTEGPFDKVVTFIAVDNYRKTVNIPNGCEDIQDVNFLCGHTLNELIQAERVATEYALTKKNRINKTIYLPVVNAFTLGELLFFFELETAYAGEMFNIDTYNQPGVEGGKNATYALLGRKGYEEKAKELKNAPKKSLKYII